MNLLLLSNSTNYGASYLEHAKSVIADFLGDVNEVLFIPYAGVTVSYEDYTQKVNDALNPFGIHVKSIASFNNPVEAVKNAKSIAVGGGNTFRLLQQLYDNDLIDVIQEKVKSGCPYIGWSAGSNVAGPSICTTNDMPIVEPQSFNALDLFPFQINPHYSEAVIPNHGGESRRARIEEYITINNTSVICLPEGTWVTANQDGYRFEGGAEMTIYQSPKLREVLTVSAANDFLNK